MRKEHKLNHNKYQEWNMISTMVDYARQYGT